MLKVASNHQVTQYLVPRTTVKRTRYETVKGALTNLNDQLEFIELLKLGFDIIELLHPWQVSWDFYL